MSYFVLILSLLYCWLSGGSVLVLGRAYEKPKNFTGFKKSIFFREIRFLPLFLLSCPYENVNGTHQFCVDSRYVFFFISKRKCDKITLTLVALGGRNYIKPWEGQICPTIKNCSNVIENPIFQSLS